jgi:leucyl-tRNA synthetase
MEMTNHMTRLRESGEPVDAEAWREASESMALLMAPVTPHIAEELWARLGKPYSVHNQRWPEHDASLAAADEVEIAVQVNGKLRARLTLPADAAEADATERALAEPSVASAIAGKPIVRVVYVANRLVNVVVRA